MRILVLVCLLATSIISAAMDKGVSAGSSARPIRILTLDWTSQVVLSHILGQLLQRYGFSVEFLDRSSDSQWFLLSSGVANVQMEIWEGSMGNRFEELTARGLIVDAGDHEALTREEWWYPAYVKPLCPGLPDWTALNGCTRLFAGDRGRRGIYYTGPWEKPDRARIRALGLKFDVRQLEDSDALRAKLDAAIAAREPIMIFNWTPNWVEVVHAGEFVEFPRYDPKCETDRGWGINPGLAWDCGNPSDGWLKKAVSKGFEQTWPCAFELISAISLSNHQIAEAAVYVEIEGLGYAEAAQRWIDGNQETVRSWIGHAACLQQTAGAPG